MAVIPAIVHGGELAPSRSVVYKVVGDTALALHIFLPKNHRASDRRPAIIFFFGGGWNGGSPSQFYPHCQALADWGMVAISAEYRVKNRHGTSPKECVLDGKSAIRWVKGHAADLGIDPARIVAGGGSAGGHVAAAAALNQTWDEVGDDLGISAVPAALVLFNPVIDNGPGGYGHERVDGYWRDISPLHNITSGAPPTLIFLGTEDKLIPVATALRYKEAMEQHGARCELQLFEGRGHGFFNYAKSREDYERTMILMQQFFAAVNVMQ